MNSYKSHGVNAHIVLACQPDTEIIVSVLKPELLPNAVDGWQTVTCKLCLGRKAPKGGGKRT